MAQFIVPTNENSSQITDNEYVRAQQEMALHAVMTNNLPMVKGIVDTAFLENNRVV